MIVDSWSATLADVHDDEDHPSGVGGECRLRHLSRLEYSAGRWGEASILVHDEGERVLRGCAGVGSGIALCGEPDLRIVSANARRVVLVDEGGLPDRHWGVHAYADDAAVTWYFDRRDCAESTAHRATGGCSD